MASLVGMNIDISQLTQNHFLYARLLMYISRNNNDTYGISSSYDFMKYPCRLRISAAHILKLWHSGLAEWFITISLIGLYFPSIISLFRSFASHISLVIFQAWGAENQIKTF